jgi:hypothetical protein
MTRLPNVIVPGAQKSGTTSLVRALERHPDCALARPKEPSFFCRAEALPDLDRYRRCFAHVRDERVVIDASTAYMVDPAVPGRLKETLGEDLRVVFILRDPVERAFSAYWHLAKRGAERRSPEEVFSFRSRDLECAAGEEAERLADALARGRLDTRELAPRYDDPLWPYRYLAGGAYLAPIQRWQRAFGRGRVKVLVLEELAADPVAVFERLARFLSLEGDPPRDGLLGVHNPTRIPRDDALGRAARALPGQAALRRLGRRLPAVARWTERALFANPPDADPALAGRLRALYAPAQRALAQHLDLDLARWWGAPQRADAVASPAA